jgi:hypothetical protein
MSDTASGSKPAKNKGAGQGWNAAADGLSVSKTFTLGSPDEAAKLAKRALQLAQKSDQTVDLRFGGSTLTIGLPAKAGVVDEAERRLAKRLEGKGTDEAKASKAAKVAAKADKPAKAPKAPAAAKPVKPGKLDKTAKAAKVAAKAAKTASKA